MEPGVEFDSFGEDVNLAIKETSGTFSRSEECSSQNQRETGSTGPLGKQSSTHSRTGDHRHLRKGADIIKSGHNKTVEEFITPVETGRKEATQGLNKRLFSYRTKQRANRTFHRRRIVKPASTKVSRSLMANSGPVDVTEESPVEILIDEDIDPVAKASEGADDNHKMDMSEGSQSLPWEMPQHQASMSNRRLRKILRELVAKRMMKLNNSLVLDPKIGALARRILVLERENRNLYHTAKTLRDALSKATKKEKTTESRGTQVTMGMILSRAAAANKGELDGSSHRAVRAAQVNSAVKQCGVFDSQTSQSPETGNMTTSVPCPTGSQVEVWPNVQVAYDNYSDIAANGSQQINYPQAIGTKDAAESCPVRPQTILADSNGIPEGSVLGKSCLPPSQPMVNLSETVDGHTMKNAGHVLARRETWPTASTARNDTDAMSAPPHLSQRSNGQQTSFSAPLTVQGYPYSVVASNQTNGNSMQMPPKVSQHPEQLRSLKESSYVASSQRESRNVPSFVPIAPRPTHSNSYNPYFEWSQPHAPVHPATVQSEQRTCSQDWTQQYPPWEYFYQTGILPENCVRPDCNSNETSRQGYSISPSTYQLHRSLGKPLQFHPNTAPQSTSAVHDGVFRYTSHQPVGFSSFETETSMSRSSSALSSVPTQERYPSSHLNQLQAMSVTTMPECSGRVAAKEQQSESVAKAEGRNWTKENEGHVNSTKPRQWTFHHLTNFTPPGAPHFVRHTSQYQRGGTYREPGERWMGKCVAAGSRSGKRATVRDIPVFPPKAGNHPPPSVCVGKQQVQMESLVQTPHHYEQKFNHQRHFPPQQPRYVSVNSLKPTPQLQLFPRQELTTEPLQQPRSQTQQESDLQLLNQQGLQSVVLHQQSNRGEEENEPALDEERAQEQQQKQNKDHVLKKGTGQVQDHVGEQQQKQEGKQKLRDQKQQQEQQQEQKEQLQIRSEHQRSQQFPRLLPPKPHRWRQQEPRQGRTGRAYEYMRTDGRDRAPDILSHCFFTANHGENGTSMTTSLERPLQASAKSHSTQHENTREGTKNTVAHEVGAGREQHHDNPRSKTQERISNITCTASAHSNCSENIPPKPVGHVIEQDHNVVFSWNICTENCVEIKSFELYILSMEMSSGQLSPGCWTEIGIVDALPLPMACTLSQFCPGITYSLKVRAVDNSGLAGPYSEPYSITLAYS